MATLPSLTLAPIGVIHTPFTDRVSAPRQAAASRGAQATVELLPGRGFEHAVEDLEGWDRLWIVFWFHMNPGWRPKVLPPRSGGERRGVFSTRSPHRPNPIGLSVVRLERVSGLTLHVRDVDMIDGTPVLDIKPYVPYADAFPDARTGWLQALPAAGAAAGAAAGDGPGAAPSAADPIDPEPGFHVAWTDRAAEQAAWLRDAHGIDLRAPVERTLALGPQPHPYRRIRADGDAMRLAVKDWRVRFRADGRSITIELITTGYRARELAVSGTAGTADTAGTAIAVHRAFLARFGGAKS